MVDAVARRQHQVRSEWDFREDVPMEQREMEEDWWQNHTVIIINNNLEWNCCSCSSGMVLCWIAAGDAASLHLMNLRRDSVASRGPWRCCCRHVAAAAVAAGCVVGVRGGLSLPLQPQNSTLSTKLLHFYCWPKVFKVSFHPSHCKCLELAFVFQCLAPSPLLITGDFCSYTYTFCTPRGGRGENLYRINPLSHSIALLLTYLRCYSTTNIIKRKGGLEREREGTLATGAFLLRM